MELGHRNRLLGILLDLVQGPRQRGQRAFPTLPGSQAKRDMDPLEPEQVLTHVVAHLTVDQLATLRDWIKEWNTNAKHAAITQALLSTILKEVPPQQLETIENVGKTLEALIAYSERHFQRIDRVLQKSYLVDFNVVSMKNLLPLQAQEEGPVRVVSDEEREADDPASRKRTMAAASPAARRCVNRGGR